MPHTLEVDIRNSLACVTLNRPNAGNSVNAAMRSEFTATMQSLNRDARVRAVVLTGAGNRVFCAGQDFEESHGMQLDQIRNWLAPQWAMYQSIRDFDKGLVTAFNGAAVGIGLQLGLLSDIRVGYPEMRLGQSEVRFGLASILGSYLISLHVSHGHNVEMSLTGELISGIKAHQIGLLNHLVPQEEVLPKAREIACSLAAVPANALRLTKTRFRQLTQPDFDDACNAVIGAHLEDYATGEPQELMRKFLEGRKKRVPG